MNPMPEKLPLLFVDDEPAVRRAFARSMTRRGFLVDTASSGLEALARIRAKPYPVVVTDLRMPGMDGNTLMQRVSALAPNTSFIVTTAMPDLDLRREDLSQAAIEAVLSKPWNTDELVDCIRMAWNAAAERQQMAPISRAARGEKIRVVAWVGHKATAAELRAASGDGRQRGYEVFFVPALEDAIEAARLGDCDVVLTDLALADVESIEAIARLQMEGSKAAIILITSTGGETQGLEAIRLGAHDWISREEISPNQLVRSVRYALERKRSEDRLSHLAHYDLLTGLPNQRNFQDRLTRLCARSRRTREPFYVMVLGIDDLKKVKEGYGHFVGDEVLRRIGERLREELRDYDTVARLSGLEFGIIVESATIPVEEIAQRIVAAIPSPVRLSNLDVPLHWNIGIAKFPEGGDEPDDLLRVASRALTRAREAGPDLFEAAAPEDILDNDRTQIHIQNQLLRAYHKQEFVVFYQPQVNLRTGTVQAMEALIRWRKPDGALAPPGEFLPALEDSPLMRDVTVWIFEQACRRQLDWKERLGVDLRIAVNLTAREFEWKDLVKHIDSVVQTTRANPTMLELEITEGVFMRDTDRTNRTLDEIRSRGIRVAIDDFGTGYASLSYLHRFPVHALKIDRSFVSQVGEHKESELIIRAIVDLAQRLGLEVVAEGLEDGNQYHFLKALGCEFGQGYWLGRPQADWSKEELEGIAARLSTDRPLLAAAIDTDR